MAEKKVAVVVVHGVANQQPSESARAIANLLTDLCPLGTYSTFQEEKIRIPLEPVIKYEEENCAGEAAQIRRLPFEERNDDALRRHRHEKVDVDPEDGFMVDQLRCYDAKKQPRVFETVRLDGIRNDSGCNVHVYEAYWADLSRLNKGILSFFGELYQLLLHLPSLGRNAVDYARAEDEKGRLWPLFSWFHRWSVRWLTLFIVVLNLMLATLVLPALAPVLTRQTVQEPAKPFKAIAACCGLPKVDKRVAKNQQEVPSVVEETVPSAVGRKVPTVVDVVTQVVLALVLLGVTALFLRHRRTPAWLWALAPIAAVVVGVFGAHVIGNSWGPGRLLVLEAWLISAGLIALLLKKYEGMRPGALWVGVIALLGTGGALLKFLREDKDALTVAVLHALQYVDVALQLAWRFHLVWLLVTIVIGLLCCLTASSGWKPQAWNTVWAARLTLTLSTALFANLTLAFWAALFTGVEKILPAAPFQPAAIHPILARLLCLNLAPTKTPSEWLQNTLMVSASFAFISITVVFALFVLAAIWAIIPSVLVETTPPEEDDKHNETTTRMRALGVWLTRGFNLIPIAAEMFSLLLVVVLFLAWFGIQKCSPPPPSSWTAISAVAALLVALIGARFWLPGASAALDVMLDVDNYLRQHPKKSTPRARIAERCASLLRFILNPERCLHDYSEVVIIAHSQGTIIFTDLLRFLRKRGHPISTDLEKKNPAFFTMGDPLRQIYARALPGLYAWAWGGPRRDELGVSQWVNAYCSGDYVGRLLTGDPVERRWDRRQGNPQNVQTPDVTSANGIDEICIGEGAHTHYWDRHGQDIAEKLDELIAVRCKNGSGGAAPVVPKP